MRNTRTTLLTALALSLAIHGVLMGSPVYRSAPPIQPPPVEVRLVAPPVSPQPPPAAEKPVRVATPTGSRPPANTQVQNREADVPQSLEAPPPPTAEEWRLAAGYTRKNSKRYRHAWGQQVRSMMGTAVAGPDQGMVRFRITINPDGSLAQVEELWTTSAKASELAWKAIKNLPPLPPTPTGEPLVFSRTISFMPYETGFPPSYKTDCLPDPPSFRNPFAWDGQGNPPGPPEAAPVPQEKEDEECDLRSTAATIEEEAGELRRQMELYRWGS